MTQTPECLSPGDTAVPDFTTTDWRVTDVQVPARGFGWLVTAWDFDHTEYGRIATPMEWLQAMERVGRGR